MSTVCSNKQATPAEAFGGSNVLILSDAPFCHSFGFGVTLRTLFKPWSNDELVTIYPAYLNTRVTIEREICRRHIPLHLPATAARRAYFSFLLGYLAGWRNKFSERWVKRQLGRWRPDILFTMTLSGTSLIYGDWLAHSLHAPHVLLVTDDFTTDQIAPEKILPIFQRANKVLVISEEMRAEYEERYGITCGVVHNGADEDLFGREFPRVPRDTFIVSYIGGLDRNFHFGAIEDIAAAVVSMNRSGFPARFEIFGSAYDPSLGESLDNGEEVCYGGVISKNEGLERMHTADLLVVPVSFDSPRLDRYRFSFPTKLPECLATGRPTLVYGPKNCAAVGFCERHGIGLVQSDRSTALVRETMIDVKQRTQFHADRAGADREFILTHHSSRVVGQRFRSIMLSTRATSPASPSFNSPS